MQIYLTAVPFELGVVFGILPAHTIGHFAGESKGRRKRFGVLSEDEPEVDMEQLAFGCHLSNVEE